MKDKKEHSNYSYFPRSSLTIAEPNRATPSYAAMASLELSWFLPFRYGWPPITGIPFAHEFPRYQSL